MSQCIGASAARLTPAGVITSFHSLIPPKDSSGKTSKRPHHLPVQTQGVQKGGEALHDKQDGYRQHCKCREDDEDDDEACPAAVVEPVVHHHGPKDL